MEFLENLNNSLLEVFGRDVKSINQKLVEIAKQNGGKAYIVGGAVRDEIMGTESKDVDYLVTKTPINDLALKLSKAFPAAKIDEVGKSFGIIKMNISGEEYDIAIPRADENRDNVKTDPNIPVESDLMRRDLSFNALAKDLETGEIISPPGVDGVADIKNKIIRAVGNPVDRFSEDPLRILRAIQFASRFGFEIEPKTMEAIKKNIDLLKKVSGERFYDEFYKGWTKGNKDTVKFFKLLDETGIGKLMFGSQFNPIPLQSDRSNDFFKKQYIAAFLNGGDYTIMNKKADEQKLVEVARIFYDIFKNNRKINEKDIRSLSNQSGSFQLINNTFNSISRELGEWLQNFLSKPIIPKKESGLEDKSYELPITGGELMELAKSIGIELKGKMIGDTVNNLILAYQNGKIEKTSNQIPEQTHEIIKNWLSNILKENWFKENKELEIVKHRMSNILYK